MRVLETAIALVAAAALGACATTAPQAGKPAETAKAKPLPKGLDSGRGPDAFASTYRPLPMAGKFGEEVIVNSEY